MRGLRRPVRLAEQGGYTTLELIGVVIVLGIVGAVGLALMSSQIGRARDATAKATVSMMAQSIERCRIEHSSYRACAARSALDDFSARWGPHPGQVGVVDAMTDDDSFAAYAVSRTKAANGYRIYAWIRKPSGVTRAVCEARSPRALAGMGCRPSPW